MKAVKVLLLAFSSVAFLATPGAQSQTIAQWTFESLTLAPSSPLTNSTSINNVPAEVGIGTASGVHATSATFSTPAGDGSTKSMSANGWSANDYWQFQTSTIGFTGISVAYDQTSSGTGPGNGALQYSTDGTLFTQVGLTYTIQVNGAPNTAWTPSTYNPVYHLSYDLSAITALDNASTVYFRIVDIGTTSANGGTVAAAGTDRVDNFTVAVPEPTSLSLFGGFGLLYLFLRRRK
jgi:hypothetical protein